MEPELSGDAAAMDRHRHPRRTGRIVYGGNRRGRVSIVRVPFGPALLAGAILSATDPIAVVAVFRRLKVPRTLATIVECESLFNDAVAVALYRGVLVAIGLGAASAGTIAIVTLIPWPVPQAARLSGLPSPL